MRGGIDALVFRLLRGLPEETIGRDRRPEHRDHGDDVVLLQRETRHEGAVQNKLPGYIHHEGNRHIREQHEAAPFQDGDIALVWRKHLEPGAADGETHNVETGRTANQQLQRSGHRAEIGAEVNRICKQQQPDDHVEQHARIPYSFRMDFGGNAGVRGTPPCRTLRLVVLQGDG